MRFLRRSLTGLFLLAVTLAVLGFAAYEVRSAIEVRLDQQSRPGMGRERVYSANVMEVVPGVESPVLETYGELRSRRTLELRSRAAGTVTELGENFVEGGRVAEGELLLRLDPAEFEDALALARTDLAEAETEHSDAEAALTIAEDDLTGARRQLELYEAALTRQEDLVARGVGTGPAVEAAQLSVVSAEQAVLSSRSALAVARTRVATAANTMERASIAVGEAERALEDTRLFAPFAGTLGEVLVIEGGVVNANEQVGSLVDPTALEVSFRLSTLQYGRLVGPGGDLVDAEVTVRLGVSESDIVTTGRIAREGAEVGDGLTGRLIFARLDPAPGLRPGDFVTVEIQEPPLTDVALVPATAVASNGTVLALGAEERLEALPVEVLRRQGNAVLIRVGALAGREIVEELSPVLGSGIRIRPVRDGAPEEAALPQMIVLDEERRARLITFVEDTPGMPDEAKARILTQLQAGEVPAEMVARLESRMGG